MLSDGYTGLSNIILKNRESSSTHDSEGDDNKKYWFNEQNNSSEHASNFLVHFGDIHVVLQHKTSDYNLNMDT